MACTLTSFILLSLAVVNVCGHYKRCERTCSTQFGVVCGSDNRNYWNECVLNNAICQDKTRKLKKVNDGPCEISYTTFVNGLSYDPVCGTDGKTYSNFAYLKIAACLTKKTIKVAFEGECKCRFYRCKRRFSCDTGCPKISSSICGSDGKFYSNQCVLDKINCILGGEKIKNLYKGVCEETFGTIPGIPPFKPVCGSDGNTYSTLEQLQISTCEDPTLIKLYDGFCR